MTLCGIKLKFVLVRVNPDRFKINVLYKKDLFRNYKLNLFNVSVSCVSSINITSSLITN